jgi:hypothetical protein
VRITASCVDEDPVDPTDSEEENETTKAQDDSEESGGQRVLVVVIIVRRGLVIVPRIAIRVTLSEEVDPQSNPRAGVSLKEDCRESESSRDGEELPTG